jgi:hypothetical protein
MRFRSARYIPATFGGRDPFSFTSDLFVHYLTRDRFNVVNRYSPLAMDDTVDVVARPPMDTYANLMDERAAEVVKRADGGRILLAWYGTVENVGIAAALLRQLHNPADLCIVHDIEHTESPGAFELLRAKHVTTIKTMDITETLGEEDCAVVLDGLENQALHGAGMHIPYTEALYHAPWIEGLNTLFNIRRHADQGNLSKRSLELLEAVWGQYAAMIGLQPMTQFCEFAWLFGFGCAFTTSRKALSLALAGTDNDGKAMAFFDTPQFEWHALEQYQKLKSQYIVPEVAAHNSELKEYVYAFTKDPGYYNFVRSEANYVVSLPAMDHITVETDEGVRIFEPATQGCGACFHALCQKLVQDFHK